MLRLACHGFRRVEATVTVPRTQAYCVVLRSGYCGMPIWRSAEPPTANFWSSTSADGVEAFWGGLVGHGVQSFLTVSYLRSRGIRAPPEDVSCKTWCLPLLNAAVRRDTYVVHTESSSFRGDFIFSKNFRFPRQAALVWEIAESRQLIGWFSRTHVGVSTAHVPGLGCHIR